MAAMRVVTQTFLKEVVKRYHGARHASNDGLLQAALYRQAIMQNFNTAFFNPQSHEVRPNAWVYEYRHKHPITRLLLLYNLLAPS